MIDIEECSLRAFEKNLFSALQRLMQIDHRVRDERPQFFPGREIICDSPRRKLIGFAPSAFRMLLFSRIFACSFFENKRGLHQIGHAQAGARGFVAVGRTDAALGRADFRWPLRSSRCSSSAR